MPDWSKVEGFPENTVYCTCGAVFRSHAMFDPTSARHMRSKKPCPQCGKDDSFRKISSDPESYTIQS